MVPLDYKIWPLKKCSDTKWVELHGLRHLVCVTWNDLKKWALTSRRAQRIEERRVSRFVSSFLCAPKWTKVNANLWLCQCGHFFQDLKIMNLRCRIRDIQILFCARSGSSSLCFANQVFEGREGQKWLDLDLCYLIGFEKWSTQYINSLKLHWKKV